MRKRSSKLKKRSARRATKAETTSAAEVTNHSAAVTLGRLGGKKGGVARARKLSAKRRSQIARKAANARWSKTQ